jgi:aldose 1-epimerase
MTTDSPLVLAADGLRATLDPAAGACLVRLDWTGPDGVTRPLLHAPPGSVPSRDAPNRFGLWPMLPFCNRAFGAVLDDGARRWALTVNDPATGSTIHGFGWQARWRIAAQNGHTVTLIHDSAPQALPWLYRAELTYALGSDGLHAALAVTNTGADTLPFGIGFHPWLPAAPDTRISLAAAGALTLGFGYRPVGHLAFADGGPLQDAPGWREAHQPEIAESLIGWTGEAHFRTPSLGLDLTMTASDTLRAPVLWTPPQAGFLCFEPQSHGIGAVSDVAGRAATPLTTLAPGETLSGWMRLKAQAI